ncbi:MAG: site-specific integrase [Bacteroidales bacterium]|nr:site-specific integrase [Bacteroidales bacterium]
MGLYLVPETSDFARSLNDAAMARAVEIQSQRVLGQRPEKEQTMGSIALVEWLDTYLAKSKRRVKPQSLRHLRILKEMVAAYLDKTERPQITLTEIDREFYKGFLAWMRGDYRVKRGANEYALTATTLYNKQRQLNQVLNAAVRQGLLEANPYAQLHASEKYPKPKTARDYLTVNELKLMAQAPTKSRHTKEAFMFRCFTGLRLSDVMALKWGDIVVNSDGVQEIRLKKQKKTAKPVVVPLNVLALKWLPQRSDAPAGALVYDLPERTTCRVCVKAMARRVGITKNVCFHTSRHTCATLNATAGTDLYTISGLLGHTSIRTTAIYADLPLSTLSTAVNRLSDILE